MPSIFERLLCGAAPPPLPKLRLHVDADRDGAVDPVYQNIDRWRWGAGHRGAIILCNNDDDPNARGLPPLTVNTADTIEVPTAGLDHHNAVIDANDAPDIAPLEIRKHHPGGANFPGGWSARLSVSVADAQRIRIFNGQAPGSAEVIGPTTANTHAIANPNVNLQYGMEALTYPVPGFKGLIDITLEVLDAGGAVRQTHVARVRVAPWMATHALNRMTRLFMMGTTTPAFDAAATRVAQKATRHSVRAAANAAGVGTYTKVNATQYNCDRWMRDIMKIGVASMPRPGPPAGWHNPVILRTAGDRCTGGAYRKLSDRYPWRELVGPDMGYVSPCYPFSLVASTRDSFGNLECSPPVPGYPFGRLVYGVNGAAGNDQMDPHVIDFLNAQKVQKPFAIDTSWLEVGHVDEVFSFVPMPTAPHGFKVAIASPASAVAALQNAHNAGHGAVQNFAGPRADPAWGNKFGGYGHLDINALLADGPLMALQTQVQTSIDGVRRVLRSKLGLTNADFMHLPVLFEDPGGGCRGYTPDVVNMIILTRAGGHADLCIPKPLGPIVGGNCIFEDIIRQALFSDYDVVPAPGKDLIYFVDDFFGYHDMRGEIHCGSNEIREQVNNTWWWEMNL